jgi:hypothetical protein
MLRCRLFLGQVATLISMKFYPLTKEKMAEIQGVLAERKAKETK